MDLTIGCDPELFLEVSGKGRSVHDLLPGTKENPHPVPYGFVQVDGVAAEFNIYPAESLADFLYHISAVKESLYDLIIAGLVEKYGVNASPFSLVAKPVMYFEETYFDKLPETPKLLGCQPDFNAYTGEQNTPPETKEPFRTGAGHIHIGWGEFFDINNPEHFITCRDVVRQLDAALYPLSMRWDRDRKRRTLYGAKGSFRPKTYGVEYRPLSNAWLNSEKTTQTVYDTALDAVSRYFKGERFF